MQHSPGESDQRPEWAPEWFPAEPPSEQLTRAKAYFVEHVTALLCIGGEHDKEKRAFFDHIEPQHVSMEIRPQWESIGSEATFHLVISFRCRMRDLTDAIGEGEFVGTFFIKDGKAIDRFTVIPQEFRGPLSAHMVRRVTEDYARQQRDYEHAVSAEEEDWAGGLEELQAWRESAMDAPFNDVEFARLEELYLELKGVDVRMN